MAARVRLSNRSTAYVFPLAAPMAIVVTLFTVSLQTVKAALANPVKSLKSE
jgi:hypothetical protein